MDFTEAVASIKLGSTELKEDNTIVESTKNNYNKLAINYQRNYRKERFHNRFYFVAAECLPFLP